MEKEELREEVETLFNDQMETVQNALHTLVLINNIDDKKSVLNNIDDKKSILEIIKSLVEEMIDECDIIKNKLI